MPPYFVKLACLSLASYFLVQVVVALLVQVVARSAIRIAERSDPRFGADLLFTLRLLPACCAVIIVFGLCVPSYARLEPAAVNEQLSVICLIAAALGISMQLAAFVRTSRAIVRSYRYLRVGQGNGRKTWFPGDTSPAWVVNGTSCTLALAGIVRPRVLVSRNLVDAFREPELTVALRHERAHAVAHDNLKRLLILLTPHVLPFHSSFRALDRSRSRLAEWAADDRAVAGDPMRATALAAALVRVSRMRADARLSPLVSSLVPDVDDLCARVERLLRTPEPPPPLRRATVAALAAMVVASAMGLVAIAVQPATQRYVHLLLEGLMD